MKKLLFLLAVCICFTSPALAQEYAEPEIPGEKLYIVSVETDDAEEEEEEENDENMFELCNEIDSDNWKQVTNNNIVLFTNKKGKTKCSGAMVGDYQVLTAAHCVMDENTGKRRHLKKEWLAWPGGKKSGIGPIGISKVAYVSKGYNPTSKTLLNRGRDYAVVQLVEPIGARTDYLIADQPLIYSGKEIDVIAFPGGGMNNDRPWLSSGVILPTMPLDPLSISRHTANSIPGSSGGPIFLKGNHDIIIGVNTAEFFSFDHNIATTPLANGLRKFIQSLWLEDDPPDRIR